METYSFKEVVEQLKVTNEKLGALQGGPAPSPSISSSLKIGFLNKMSGIFPDMIAHKRAEQNEVASAPELTASVNFTSIVGNTVKMAALAKLSKMFPQLIKGSMAGFGKFADVLKKIGKRGDDITKGTTSLNDLSTAFGNFAQVEWSKIFLGAAAMATLLPPLTIFGTLMTTKFGKDVMKSAAKGMGYLQEIFEKIGKSATNITKAGIALAVIGSALWISGKGFQSFADVKWSDVGKGVVALGALTIGAAALGAVMSSGIGAVAMLAGAAAIAVLGAALIPAAYAMNLAGEGLSAMGAGLSDIVPQLASLATMAQPLLATAAAITAISLALGAFAVGNAASGISTLFTKITGSSPIDQLQKLAACGPGLQQAADSLDKIQKGLNPSSNTSGRVSALADTRDAIEDSRSSLVNGGGDDGSSSYSRTSSSATNSTVNSVIVNNGFMPDRSTALILSPAY